MYVTRCYHRFSVFFTKLHNPAVDVPDIFHAVNGRNPFGFDHELIVPKRLDFQIIIKVHKPCNLGFRLIFKQSPVEFSCLTGTPQYQAFPVLHQKAFRYTGTLAVIIQMRCRNEPVQILSSDIVLCQNNGMIRRKTLHNLLAGSSPFINLL